MVTDKFKHITADIERLPTVHIYGRVTAVLGILIECKGIQDVISVGSRVQIITRTGREVSAEVVGLKQESAMLMPFSDVEGIGVGCRVRVDNTGSSIYPCDAWLGRVLNALGETVDDHGVLPKGEVPYHVKAMPPPAHKRNPVGEKIDLGVRSVNTFLSCCRGQRMGIFAGSGIGKSMLIAMLTKFSTADIKVIGLIGERGREVQEFIHEYLGPEGMKSAVVIAATSDESALMRRQAAYTTMAVAEYFRDQGKDVLCLMDSVTRFAMAQREIGLSAGEPPATKGYTPTVFVEMPKLLERAGPGVGKGSITGLFTVLVEGDDHNEPISDAVRGILDGHIVLDRAIAMRGHFPAVNILRSVSRTMPGCNTADQNALVTKARQLLATYDDMAEMIRLGAYRRGSDPKVDEAIAYNDALNGFLQQAPDEKTPLNQCYKQLQSILNNAPPAPAAQVGSPPANGGG